MKTSTSTISASGSQRVRLSAKSAFTVAEIAIATGIFTLVMGSVLTLYVFSARTTSGVGRQLEFDSQSRVLNMLLKEVKTSQSVDIQSYNGTNFTSVPVGSAQQGNAMVITCPSGTSTQQVYYWLDSSGNFYRSINGTTKPKRWLTNVTNSNPFALMSYTGTLFSNDYARMLVNVDLQALDTNIRNYRQSITLHAAAARRN